MPPRRSCFSFASSSPAPAAGAFQCHRGVPASRERLDEGRLAHERFNATTAFLLHQVGFAPTRSPGGVSMPPRRSCFLVCRLRAPGPFRVSMPPRRSCFHLNVQATSPCFVVSMPPRRSCFPGGWFELKHVRVKFQCHHGVPASRRTWLTKVSTSSGFNATTAFLLLLANPRSFRAPARFQCHHGVPASGRGGVLPVGVVKFQCHHGVPASSNRAASGYRSNDVSMPPRRSCFYVP